MAARTTLTPAVTVKICAKILAGCSLVEAGPAIGVPWPTVRDWYNKGKRDDAPEIFVAFREAVDLAKGQWGAMMLARIQKHSIKDANTAKWLVERRLRGYYKPIERAPAAPATPPVVLLYPVVAPLGAEPPQPVRVLPGQAYDVDAEVDEDE